MEQPVQPVQPVQPSIEHKHNDAKADRPQDVMEPQPPRDIELPSESSRRQASSSVAAQCGSAQSTKASHEEENITSKTDRKKDSKDSKDLKKQTPSDESSYRGIAKDLVSYAGGQFDNHNTDARQIRLDVSWSPK
ncbi:hypothetical protein CPAR01_11850 [Colletotrichum paranaense]|uniref:Uncharacterized protein n=2 Tax=Colletotrichum acutatum species complex TaxID=2707335 RepID=A0AAI9Y3Q0_9PEZI|nr:uncharacterized protein CPAR01_11850 [Colletotrichum paranaense]KAK1469647.1 hypothetical protein CMEL01_01414 [Colletotrichum melonis]KAK1529538.1 hypothetical protein CPAR01_11850 [Colletotrichum paranaense]